PHGKASVYGGGAGSAWSGGSSSSRGPSGRGSSGGGSGGKPPRNSSGSRTSRPYPSGPGRTKRRTPWWATLTLVLGLLVMIAGLGGMVATKFVTGRVDSAISQVSLLAPGGGAKATSIDGSINLLMVGLDTRDNNPGMGSRSDSIIIGHIPATHDQVDLISIPRDTYVPIPAYRPSHFNGAHD